MRKIKTILKGIDKYEGKIIERIKKGRNGGGAGGFNRDLNNLQHKINLLKDELKEVLNSVKVLQ